MLGFEVCIGGKKYESSHTKGGDMYILSTERNKRRLEAAGLFKLALDVSIAMDRLYFPIDLNDWQSDGEVSGREELFHLLSAICYRSGVTIPIYENIFIEAWLPKFERCVKPEEKKEKISRAKNLREKISRKVRGMPGRDARRCRMLSEVLEIFPDASDDFSGGIKPRQLCALINDSFLRLGLDPLRPDYSELKIPETIKEAGPLQEQKVLIVDDDKNAIRKTFRALMGWPKLELEFFHYHEGVGSGEYPPIAEKILKENPDIILMDQSMRDIEGDILVRKIKQLARRPLVFIGNTGGGDDKLRRAGCLGNLDKGGSLSALRSVLR